MLPSRLDGMGGGEGSYLLLNIALKVERMFPSKPDLMKVIAAWFKHALSI
jgi:hypothetical protein